MKRNSADDFWRNVKKRSGCWEWRGGSFDEDGYGLFCYGNRLVRATRFLMGTILGHDVTGLVVRHSCDNPRCVNPAHLLLGTHLDNARDRESRGRGVRGRKQTKEHISARFASREGWKHSPETRETLRRLATGKRHTEEAKAKMSEARRGRPQPWLIGLMAGSKNGNAKLTEEIVKRMRSDHAAGMSKARVAKKYGISETQTGRILRREQWANA